MRRAAALDAAHGAAAASSWLRDARVPAPLSGAPDLVNEQWPTRGRIWPSSRGARRAERVAAARIAGASHVAWASAVAAGAPYEIKSSSAATRAEWQSKTLPEAKARDAAEAARKAGGSNEGCSPAGYRYEFTQARARMPTF